MAGDKELLKENWEGKIPILFRLSEDDQFIREDCEPLLLSIRRQSYFPISLYEKVNNYFKKFLAPDCSLLNSWMEDQNGETVKWHWPVGVLFDLQCLSDKCVQIPWTITVHYSNFPKADLIAFQSQDSIKSFFMSAIKEADFLKYRGHNINSMKPADVASLYESMMKENFEGFWSVNQQLMGTPSSYQTKDSYKHVPFKIHFCNNKTAQTLITPFDSTGKPHTLFDLFKVVFFPRSSGKSSPVNQCTVKLENLETPSATGDVDSDKQQQSDLPTPSLESIQKPSDTTNTEATTEAETIEEKVSNEEEMFICEEKKIAKDEEEMVKSIEGLTFLIHGIAPPLSMPIQWMYNHLTYPDNFVHICVADPL